MRQIENTNACKIIFGKYDMALMGFRILRPGLHPNFNFDEFSRATELGRRS